jgi:hypothetical protein
MNDINDKIKTYLAQDEPEFFEGLELYQNHPDARKNLIVNFRQNSNHGRIHNKLINELERIVNAVYTNRNAKYIHSQANVPYKLVEKTKELAPENFEYKIAFNDLPKELQEKAIFKGQLYSELEKEKREMANLGDANDEETIAKRQKHLMKMRDMQEGILSIHAILLHYDKTQNYDPSVAIEKEEIPVVNDSDELENEFHYKEMGYYKRKDLLIKLRSSVPKQEQRANSSKPEIKKKNLEKAALGREMIAVLEKYFNETPEPEK